MASFFVKAQLLPTGHDPEDIDGFTLNGESNAQASFEADDPQAIPNLAPNRSSLWKAFAPLSHRARLNPTLSESPPFGILQNGAARHTSRKSPARRPGFFSISTRQTLEGCRTTAPWAVVEILAIEAVEAVGAEEVALGLDEVRRSPALAVSIEIGERRG